MSDEDKTPAVTLAMVNGVLMVVPLTEEGAELIRQIKDLPPPAAPKQP